MSRAIRFHEFGGPEVLRLEDIAVRAPGPGEVRIKVAAIGLNFADVMWRKNEYIEIPQLPSGLGYDVSGTIESIDPGVTDFAIGDKVATFPSHNQGEHAAYGELVLMPTVAVSRYPETLSPVQAAAYLNAFLTGYFALFEVARLTAGQTILVTAGSSSTGQAAIQMAKFVGARVIATTRTRAKIAAIAMAGADWVIATDEEDLAALVGAASDGRGVDVAYDAVGGKQLATLGDVVAPRGDLILYGVKGGTEMAVHVYKIFEFTGSPSLGLPRNAEALARGFSFIHHGITTGAFKPVIDSTFPLERMADAHQRIESGDQVGKVLLTP